MSNNTKQRIALFVPSLRGGGAERVMVTLANSFSEKCYSVDMILAKEEGPYLSELSSNVRVIDLGQPRVAFTLLGLIRYLRKERPIAMLSTLSHVNIMAIFAKKFSGTSTRIIVRQASTLNANIDGLFMTLLTPFIYSFADEVVAVSKGVANSLVATAGLLEKKITVIYNPIVNDELFVKANASIEQPWFQKRESSIILSVGRLDKFKDFGMLIDALKIVKKSRPVKLIILGEGSSREMLEEKIIASNLSEDVLLPGFIQNPFPFMKKADLFVLSSISEGLPNALIQSLALGVPVVSTDCPNGPDEILESGRWGQLVPIKNSQLMSEAILSALKSSSNNNQESMDYCKKKFGVDNVVMKYLAILMNHL